MTVSLIANCRDLRPPFVSILFVEDRVEIGEFFASFGQSVDSLDIILAAFMNFVLILQDGPAKTVHCIITARVCNEATKVALFASNVLENNYNKFVHEYK